MNDDTGVSARSVRPADGDVIPPGSFYANVVYRQIKYRTKDGQADYAFSFERLDNGKHRAYILSQPSYGFRDQGLHATHRLRDGIRFYVCWTPEPTDEATLRQVVALWCNLTQEYIRSGQRLEDQVARMKRGY